jgi:hypothetical protein
VAEREADLGGGAAAFLGSAFSAPAFLFTQRLRSGSYTKLLASPSFAVITGLFGNCSCAASFLPPPNHPPKPQPFFPCCCWLAARLAR